MGQVRQIQQLEAITVPAKRVREQLARWEGQAEILDEQINDAKKNGGYLLDEIRLYEQALAALETLEQKWRGTFEGALAGIVGQGLTAIFEEEIKVLMESTTKRGAAHLDINLETEGLRTGVLGAKGGSVVNAMDAFLRMIMTIRNRPELRRFGAWDEPFSMVSAEFRPALCATLKDVVQRLDFQLLLSSHEDELLDASDTAYHILKDGNGTAKRLKSPNEEEVLL